MYSVKIIKDSIGNTTGNRLTTFELTYPRMVHAELMTHRLFCLAGDSELEFDLPSGQSNGGKRVYRMRLDDPIKSLDELKSCRGVRDVEKKDRQLHCTVTLRHHWWGGIFVKANLATLEVFARNKFPAGVCFDAEATVDNPSWRVSVAMFFIGATVSALILY